MNWKQLLSSKRIGKDRIDPLLPHRSPFEMDADRIMFSSAFRRMSDKMQVHGLSGSAYVRTRLTHSLEVSRVARSLGALAGQHVVETHLRGGDVTAADLGHIVSAAALAHDIGNPPFGHTGEHVISSWCQTSPLGTKLMQQIPDRSRPSFEYFEGNAHGFRILTQLQGWRETGGLQLTAATLGAFTKYPWGAEHRNAKNKFGFFDSEAEIFAEVAKATGMLKGDRPGTWCRHPLAYLVEAADDICYSIVDLEDGYKMRCLSFDEVEQLVAPIANPSAEEYAGIADKDRKLLYLRSRAIEHLVRAAAAAFVDNHDAILAGKFRGSLPDETPYADQLAVISEVSRERIYRSAARNTVDLIACQNITTLLEVWCQAFHEYAELKRDSGNAEPDEKLCPRSRFAIRALPNHKLIDVGDTAVWLRAVLDHVAGMTDGFCVEQARLLHS